MSGGVVSGREAAREVLRPHWRTDCSEAIDGNYVRWVRCRCGWASEKSPDAVNVPDLHDIWNGHLADHLADLLATERQRGRDEALREARDALYRGEGPDLFQDADIIYGEWLGNRADRALADVPAAADWERGALCEDCGGTGRTVQGWTDKRGYPEDQYGPCATCSKEVQ